MLEIDRREKELKKNISDVEQRVKDFAKEEIQKSIANSQLISPNVLTPRNLSSRISKNNSSKRLIETNNQDKPVFSPKNVRSVPSSRNLVDKKKLSEAQLVSFSQPPVKKEPNNEGESANQSH